MRQRYIHVAGVSCDGSNNELLILELHPKLSETQKRKFTERIKTENTEEVLCACWRKSRIVRITLRKKNCAYARIDLPQKADALISALFEEEGANQNGAQSGPDILPGPKLC